MENAITKTKTVLDVEGKTQYTFVKLLTGQYYVLMQYINLTEHDYKVMSKQEILDMYGIKLNF